MKNELLKLAAEMREKAGKRYADAWAGNYREWASRLEAVGEAADEIELLRDALKLKTAGEEYAHRLAVMLECALLDRRGTWDDGHALLAEYREACRMTDEPPTFMGEPTYEVHVAGPDDVIPCATEIEAHRTANATNKAYLADRAKNPDSEVLCVATVHERPNDPSSGAAKPSPGARC